LTRTSPVRAARVILALGALSVSVSACTRIDNALAAIPVFAFMRSAPSFDPYEGTRPPPPNSVPYETPNGPPEAPLENNDAALTAFGNSVKNPIPMSDRAALARGQLMFERDCFVCHGPEGKGDGPILTKPNDPGKFPFAPNLTVAPTTTRADGYSYGMIRVGRGLMPAYGDKIAQHDRWAIVNYVRELQAAAAGAAAAAPAPAAPR
jgi:mono/diheme cytochrome c family protein